MADLVKSAWKIIPKFHSRDVAATAAFYAHELHFIVGSVSPSTADSKGFCSACMGRHCAANIYFFECAPEDFQAREAMISMGTRSLDAYYALLRAAGTVQIVEEIADREWGYRQFTVHDGDGNALTFFRFLEGSNPGDAEEEEEEEEEKKGDEVVEGPK